MSAERIYSFNGWTVQFHQNIHMYSHGVKLSRGSEAYSVFCENTPSGFVGIWPYELQVNNDTFQELLAVLRKWANHSGFQYRLYTTPTEFETSGTKD
jgi:hypothetical protein